MTYSPYTRELVWALESESPTSYLAAFNHFKFKTKIHFRSHELSGNIFLTYVYRLVHTTQNHHYFKNICARRIYWSRLNSNYLSYWISYSIFRYLLKGIVKWTDPCKCVILLVSRILWHKRINPSLKEWRFWYLILTGHFSP